MSTFSKQKSKYLNDYDDDVDYDDSDDDECHDDDDGFGGGGEDDDNSDHFHQYHLADPQGHIHLRPCFLRYKWFMVTKGPC